MFAKKNSTIVLGVFLLSCILVLAPQPEMTFAHHLPPSQVIEAEDASRVARSAGWLVAGGTVLHNSLALESIASGATLTVNFTGTSFSVSRSIGPNVGSFTVSVDGGTPVLVDSLSSTFQFQQEAVIATGLPPGSHTAVLTVVSLRQQIDFFKVDPQPDTIAPTIVAPSDVSLQCDRSTDPANTGSATATDNFDPNPAITFSDATSAGASPDEFTLARTWTATDYSGNASSAGQIITVVDTMAPLLTAPADVVVTANTAGGYAGSIGAATATDNCDPNPTISHDAPAVFPVGDTTVTWTVTDRSGHTASATQIVSAVDTTAPTIVAPSDVSIQCGQSTDPSNTGSATATDNVDPNPAITFSDATSPGASPDAFTLARNWTATDYSGNASSAGQIITVVDTMAPLLTAPADIAVTANTAGGFAGSIGAATATDNCDPNPTIAHDAPAVFPVGDTTITWTVTDRSGNTASATQTVTTVPISVAIDIKPGSDPSCINPGSNGVIPVAILTTAGFDASSVNPLSVTLEGAAVRVKGKSGNAGSLEDVDSDGDQDLMVQINNELGLAEGQTTAILTGETTTGIPIEGIDTICVVP